MTRIFMLSLKRQEQIRVNDPKPRSKQVWDKIESDSKNKLLKEGTK